MSARYKIPTKLITMISVAVCVWSVWLLGLGPANAFGYIVDNWQVALTMVGGSLIAGISSVGGGAVAFPVFTKMLHVAPADAKVFSLAIQSVGMTAAAITIWRNRIPVDWTVVYYGSLGGLLGMGLGCSFLQVAVLSPAVLKLSFTAVLASFAMTLLYLNHSQRECHERVPVWGFNEVCIVVAAGTIGGLMSALIGNGIDIFLFSVMVLLFRVSEKVSTPTSVILMAINAVVGFGLNALLMDSFNEVVQSYWFAAIPIVVIGAPLGAIICNFLARQAIANLLVSLIAIEVVSSLLLVPLDFAIGSFSLMVLIVFSGLNYWMYRVQFYEPRVFSPTPLSGTEAVSPLATKPTMARF